MLLDWSWAVTVKLKAVPAVALDGADTAKWVAAPAADSRDEHGLTAPRPSPRGPVCTWLVSPQPVFPHLECYRGLYSSLN